MTCPACGGADAEDGPVSAWPKRERKGKAA